jgi:predicted nucleic acid-binding protein
MKYLVDTNVWLEVLLEQERSDECKEFFQNVETNLIAISEFSLYSIGIILCRLNKDELFENFLDDIMSSFISKINLEIDDIKYLLQIRKKYNFDFDDAYQYVVAEKYSLTIISFDSDFDKTPLGRKTPKEVLEELNLLRQK